MKKSTVRITIVLIILVVGVVGVYAYLASRSRNIAEGVSMTNVEKVLSRDMGYDYPPTPKELLKYYGEIQKCFYNEDCTDDEIEALMDRARELYDEELLANNERSIHIVALKEEIRDYKDHKRRITAVSVAASTNVDYFEEDGYEFARIYCGFNITEGSKTQQARQIFLLRRDGDRRWKIYGWDSQDHVNPQ
ncbi:MAG: hypothetical protein NC420_14310 [Eubacterium sp.]|nr:hypothetical protein [Eubacterium sp.]MCM1213388.1 hypothetical protein [Lachnospiraceae bacterium]MCM1305125.1 hypothetical protein [Butyrivibrio sp.]MCM1344107.1 hypothetical protein [Muribaculaceae bacterium]MCM1241107.1 hypothetical protein [Lachnospiraceae bacterium]